MIITSLRARNYRNFQEIHITVGDRTFLVGPNASGKSNLLDIFRFLHDIASVGGGLQKAIQERGGFSILRSLSARKVSYIMIEIDLHDPEKNNTWTYTLQFNQSSSKNAKIVREIVKKNDKPLLSRPLPDDKSDPERLTQTFLEQVNVNQEFREIAEFFTTVSYLHIIPQLIREPERSIGYLNDPFGGDFLDRILQENKKQRPHKLEYLLNVLKSAIPQLSAITIDRDSKGTAHLKAKYKNWRPQGTWQDERQLSDGTLRLIGLLWAILEGSGPLLLEEPELSLHPAIVHNIPQILIQIQHLLPRQIIISTHSPDLLEDEGIGLDEVLLLIPTPEGTVVQPASDLKDAKILLKSGLSLADIVKATTRPQDLMDFTSFGEQE